MDFSNFEPCLLIAMPELQDPNFHKSVLLLTDYTAEGASGFVINRHTDLTLGDSILLSEGSLNPDYETEHLYFGGPVDPEKIWILYDENIHSGPKDTHLGDHVMIASDIDILINHEKTLDFSRVRVVHGYSGWGAKQLEAELAVSSWITAPLSRKLLFDTPETKIWEESIKQLGFDPKKLMGSHSDFLN